MSEDDMLKCLIAFVLGFLVHRMMRGNGLSVGGKKSRRARHNLKRLRKKRSDIIRELELHKKKRNKLLKKITNIDKKLGTKRQHEGTKSQHDFMTQENQEDECILGFMGYPGISCNDNWCFENAFDYRNIAYQHCHVNDNLCCRNA